MLSELKEWLNSSKYDNEVSQRSEGCVYHYSIRALKPQAANLYDSYYQPLLPRRAGDDIRSWIPALVVGAGFDPF